ncbi:MAG: DUF669 domain-containing protein [Acidobacteria bacterium]|nr:MAG: DUF669 domain-containing protein [Acidobacteriota bacterium]
MANLNGFDARTVEPAAGFEPVPAGKYLAVITESEHRPTKAGDGRYLQLTFQVIEGEHKGRLLWARLCLEHPNAQTVQIARGQLSAICRAVGVMTPRDSVELHNLPLVIRVACKKRDDTGEIVNEIRGFEARQRVEPATAAAAAGGTPPWKR